MRRWRAPQEVAVLGAGLAGLLAAAAASDDGRRSVTVLERDRLPDRPVPRAGVPQGRQPHVFLYRGLQAIEEILPGFSSELRAAGAVAFDTGDLAWFGEFGWAPPDRQEFTILSATRPLFEHVVLSRVRALASVSVRDGVRVQGIRRGDSNGPRLRVDLADGGDAIGADLVIDATGRGSRLPAWLAQLGVGPVPTTALDARVGYASRLYDVPRGRLAVAGIVLLQSPDRPTGSLVLPVEAGRWHVAAIGSGERRPPRDDGGFRNFLTGLPDRAVADLTAVSQPLTAVAVHRQTGNRRLHVEKVRNWPAGLLVVGDALCAFNPVYGQGVTVAALEALALRRTLHRGLRAGSERRLHRRFARIGAVPWSIATAEDQRLLRGAGRAPLKQRLIGRWTRELWRMSADGDRVAHDAIARVYHLVGSPWLLLSPRLVLRLVRSRVRGYGQPSPRPQGLGGGALAGRRRAQP